MDQRFQRIVTSAIDSGYVRLRNHPDGSKFTDKDHVECVKKILDLVAKETTTDRVKRLIRMTKDVYDCKRGAKESFAEYSTRFESLARAYLSTARAQIDSQDEQNFAIMAVENANLPISTYNAIITNLVSHGKENVKPRMVTIPSDVITAIIQGVQQIHSTLHATLVDSSQDDTATTTAEMRLRTIRSLTQQMISKTQSVLIPTTVDEPTHQYAISLTRALEELQDVRTEDQRKNESVSVNGHAQVPTPGAQQKSDNSNTQVGAMMTSNREDKKNDSNGSGTGTKNQRNNRQRRGKRRCGRGRSSSRSRKQQRREDIDTDRDESSSEEEWEDNRKKHRNVFDRLGSKSKDHDKQQKKVRFDNRRDQQDQSESENDSYFRKGGRHRS